MAIDREALAAALGVPRPRRRAPALLPGVQELPRPAQPDWAAAPLPMRRELAARAIAALGLEAPLRVRVAMPDGPGYRHRLRPSAARLAADRRRGRCGSRRTRRADLRLIDAVAPANLATWYLRHFTCEASAVCDPAADEALLAARLAPRPAERQRAVRRSPTGSLTELDAVHPADRRRCAGRWCRRG